MCDSVVDYFLCTEDSAIQNLINEGKNPNNIFLVGNLMIDSLFNQIKIQKNKAKNNNYAVVTMHRPSNVDNDLQLKKNIEIINAISNKISIVFPVHPRTKNKLKAFKLNNNVKIVDPLGYKDFIKLWSNSKFIITDSGGIQEETTALKIPCLTIRDNTERPITISLGSNTLVGSDKNKILNAVDQILKNQYKKSFIPKFWDGMASKRIIKILNDINER